MALGVQIPEYLKQYITQQNYGLYTAIDHASWRYIMRVSKHFFKDYAHAKYLSGLEQTGISVERIPRIEEIDEKLKKFGWRAAAVTGFIPPAVFLEFLSLSVLPIACDMRRLEHLEYTPSPDIVHEAAGHAPIISDPKFASYLKKFGEIARKAIFAKEDLDVYEAIKYLSDIKEDPKTKPEEVAEAYKRLEIAQASVTYVSEASQLSRLGWWSTEYGLVKNANDYKIYGAGLLSSVGESYNAIKGDVEKVPLTLDCVKVNFDITKPQPQLFYVENFESLEKIIDQLAATMAYKLGGVEALMRAQRAKTVTTTVLDSGLQISGVLSNVVLAENAEDAIYLQYAGPTQLAFGDQELAGHSPKYHLHGFGTPLGLIKNTKKTAAELNEEDLKNISRLEFDSGVVVEGQYQQSVKKGQSYVVHSFKNCKVYRGDRVFFEPDWGVFDMACGRQVTSVFGGAADRAAYLASTEGLSAKVKSQSSNETAENRKLAMLYQKLRDWREKKVSMKPHEVSGFVAELDSLSQDDWLLRLELLEMLKLTQDPNEKKVAQKLDHLKKKSKVYNELITRGLELI